MCSPSCQLCNKLLFNFGLFVLDTNVPIYIDSPVAHFMQHSPHLTSCFLDCESSSQTSDTPNENHFLRKTMAEKQGNRLVTSSLDLLMLVPPDNSEWLHGEQSPLPAHLHAFQKQDFPSVWYTPPQHLLSKQLGQKLLPRKILIELCLRAGVWLTSCMLATEQINSLNKCGN